MNGKQRIKQSVYAVAKSVGLFSVSRFLMRKRLMILAYHGFQYDDEASFRPILFMAPERFAERLEIIKRGNYPVLPLAEAVQRCNDGTLPANAIAITIDDGFFSVLDLAAPLLDKYGFPATLYVTSYYVGKGTPIFRLVIQYLFWKTQASSFEPLDYPWSPTVSVNLDDAKAAHEAMWQIINYGEQQGDESLRQSICAEVANHLNLDFQALGDARSLSLLTPDELLELEALGVDIQLHTHRHTFSPKDQEQARKELVENRHALEKILKRDLKQFCYPSGVWSPDSLAMLTEEGIETATTCQAGLNDRTTHPLALYRILDQDNLPELEFEAELSGFCELIRIVTLKRQRNDKRHSIAAAKHG